MSSHFLGCMNCAFLVIVGAAGGHKKEWTQERKDTFQKAQFYHFTNGAGIILSSFVNQSMQLSSVLFILGTALFCASLYHKAFTQKDDYSKIYPPFGGMCMILGWIALALKK
ncbi:inner membrane protein, putative [Ichthyophthirius multifiliis]|uniref:Inner membrane protein, putative n=1 Tax=Ichthyophthirius multifiliis TaxID=5932 RepID=G0QZL2_ICHMU|nr:inner membrane protein, putative [Ichthyophthirius multifiliis]EGR29343.1 inner membrane protein, putative [Ichthyophthirius multifiliis]|eukprot:XP_004030579.1 inner membrane protein, putative [Ichthyophthirius multifiliis]